MALGNHKDFRTLSKDRSWQGTMTDSGRLLLAALQALVYGAEKDGALKTTLKSCCDVAEFVSQCSLVAEILDEVKTTAQKELGRPKDDLNSGGPAMMDDANGDMVSFDLLLDKEQREILNNLSEDQAVKLEEWRDYLGGMVDQPLD